MDSFLLRPPPGCEWTPRDPRARTREGPPPAPLEFASLASENQLPFPHPEKIRSTPLTAHSTRRTMSTMANNKPMDEVLFGGSVLGKGPLLIAVWAYALSTMEYECSWAPEAHYVTTLNPRVVALVLGAGVGEVEEVLTSLCASGDLVPLWTEHKGVGPTLFRVVDGEGITRRLAAWGRREYAKLMKRDQRARAAAGFGS